MNNEHVSSPVGVSKQREPGYSLSKDSSVLMDRWLGGVKQKQQLTLSFAKRQTLVFSISVFHHLRASLCFDPQQREYLWSQLWTFHSLFLLFILLHVRQKCSLEQTGGKVASSGLSFFKWEYFVLMLQTIFALMQTNCSRVENRLQTRSNETTFPPLSSGPYRLSLTFPFEFQAPLELSKYWLSNPRVYGN